MPRGPEPAGAASASASVSVDAVPSDAQPMSAMSESLGGCASAVATVLVVAPVEALALVEVEDEAVEGGVT